MPDKFDKYMKGANFLHTKAPALLRSVLVTINHKRQIKNPDEKKIHHYYDLPEYMLDSSFFDLFLTVIKDLGSDTPEVLNEFLRIIDESIVSSMQLVRDYMEDIPDGTIFKSKNTLGDLIDTFRHMPAHARYLLVVDSGNLFGLMSVVDFDDNLDKIKSMDRNTLISRLPFLTLAKNVITVNADDTMSNVKVTFKRLRDSGKKITKILVVDSYRRPVGFIDQIGLSKWEASSLD